MLSALRGPFQGGLALAIVGLAGIGWVARSTRAQNASQELPPASPPAAAGPAEGAQPGSLLPPPREEAAAAPAPVVSPRSPFELDPLLPLAPPGGSDDPEKHAQAFIDQNRKVAEAQLKTLREEAEKLRARLQKVDAGIKRWEALVAALPTSDQVTSSGTEERLPERSGASDREPVPRRRPQFSARAAPATDPATADGSSPRDPSAAGPAARPAPPPPGAEPALPRTQAAPR